MIHNAVRIYQKFINDQLNKNTETGIRSRLKSIEELIKGLKTKQQLIEQEKHEINNKASKLDISQEDYKIISKKILQLLGDWGALNERTIANHLNYPTWIIWTVLNKLKANGDVKLKGGEWRV
jgi:predicted transcriptional regulator